MNIVWAFNLTSDVNISFDLDLYIVVRACFFQDSTFDIDSCYSQE